MLLTSKAFLDKLPEDLRKVVVDAGRMFVLAQRDMIAKLELDRIEELKAKGMQFNQLSHEQLQVFKRTADPIYDKYEEIIGKEIMDIAREIRK
jgi:TRAP-type C4-dicarboxylate transport system substrate-binding protein